MESSLHLSVPLTIHWSEQNFSVHRDWLHKVGADMSSRLWRTWFCRIFVSSDSEYRSVFFVWVCWQSDSWILRNCLWAAVSVSNKPVAHPPRKTTSLTRVPSRSTASSSIFIFGLLLAGIGFQPFLYFLMCQLPFTYPAATNSIDQGQQFI